MVQQFVATFVPNWEVCDEVDNLKFRYFKATFEVQLYAIHCCGKLLRIAEDESHVFSKEITVKLFDLAGISWCRYHLSNTTAHVCTVANYKVYKNYSLNHSVPCTKLKTLFI